VPEETWRGLHPPPPVPLPSQRLPPPAPRPMQQQALLRLVPLQFAPECWRLLFFYLMVLKNVCKVVGVKIIIIIS